MTRLKTRGGKESFVSRLPSGDGIRSHLCTHSDQARPYAKPLENFYNRITDLVSEMQQRRVVRKASPAARSTRCSRARSRRLPVIDTQANPNASQPSIGQASEKTRMRGRALTGSCTPRPSTRERAREAHEE